MKSPAWRSFVAELKASMAVREITARDLAAKLSLLGLDVDAQKVHAWRQGRSSPDIDWLPVIARVLEMGDSTELDESSLYRRMGLLPSVDRNAAHDLAYRVQKLELRLQASIERTATLGRRHGLEYVMNAVSQSGRWAAALWPAVEGPSACQMHVADRIDIRRCDGVSTTTREAFDDPSLREALRLAYAVPVSANALAPRWTHTNESVDDKSLSLGIARFSISYVGSPASPIRYSPHPGMPSMVCYALTIESWVNDIASLLSRAIGYGLSTTRDIAMEVEGIPSGSTTPGARSRSHARFLGSPPKRRVWSHHAQPDEYCPDPFSTRDPDVHVVWIRESDEHLRAFAESNRPDRASLKELLDARDYLDARAATHPTGIQVIEADAYSSLRNERWSEVLGAVAKIYGELQSTQRLHPDNRHTWERARVLDPGASEPFLAWLDAQVTKM